MTFERQPAHEAARRDGVSGVVDPCSPLRRRRAGFAGLTAPYQWKAAISSSSELVTGKADDRYDGADFRADTAPTAGVRGERRPRGRERGSTPAPGTPCGENHERDESEGTLLP